MSLIATVNTIVGCPCNILGEGEEKINVNMFMALIHIRRWNSCVFFFMEYITMCLDSTNKLEHWYVRNN